MSDHAVSRRTVVSGVAGAAALSLLPRRASADSPPNVVFIMTDDHATHAVSAYGSAINDTPNIDRIAREGIRFDNAFCTNSICTPSRAAILTGTYSHVNGVTTLDTPFDATQSAFPALLQAAGYQTALFGKWHLGHGGLHDPRGFDHWAVLQGQGPYVNPQLITPEGRVSHTGYTTDIITDVALDWLDRRDPSRPFCLLVHQKAPHRPWRPDEAHGDMYEDAIPQPATLRDDYAGRSAAAAAARMGVARDLTATDLKEPVPDGLSSDEELDWKYQRYMEDYLRCVASVDDNVGRLLDHLDAQGLTDDTLVIYTSDQGFFLGDHGWFDKRFMYEPSLRMPLLVRYPRRIAPGSASDAIVLNIDYAQTLLDLAGIPDTAVPQRMQGRSLTPLFGGHTPKGWRRSMYYRYWMHDDSAHHVRAHYGVRTERHKLIFYYGEGLGVPGASDRVFPPEWELFDLHNDPDELHNVHDHPAYAPVQAGLERELARLQRLYGDEPAPAQAA
ncbi:sulfatase [Streptomyces sp. NBC_01808]|uniref:sulfatase family protein n=1 Tax=Streptomyces sp. NBC_01808 TaxID=2975947 RepID=UPI002DD7E155|nr:sulfatase [Streptomyces sp. NBC_01808]WSA35944.1 sulfatase [Streptomyces sp. NBC_01808]